MATHPHILALLVEVQSANFLELGSPRLEVLRQTRLHHSALALLVGIGRLQHDKCVSSPEAGEKSGLSLPPKPSRHLDL